MAEIDPNKPVLVTGGAGFIASWIVRYLLEDGRKVRASVRSLKKADRIQHLLDLSAKHPGKLELFEADLLQPGSFDPAMADCALVIHAASPFFIAGIKDPQKDLIEPAVEGTRNVLQAASRADGVRRVVLTSSVAAIMGDGADAATLPAMTVTEEQWNTSSSLKHQPYSYSKTQAEREAWRIAEGQKQWQLVVINPSFVLGPALSARDDSTSVNFIRAMIDGTYRPGAPDLTMGIVDVRDVARAHILAGFGEGVQGRHILAAETMPMAAVARTLDGIYGSRFPIPRRTLPKALLYLIGPFFGLSWGYITRNVGHPYKLDASKSKEQLGLQYRSVAETLRDAVEHTISVGLVK